MSRIAKVPLPVPKGVEVAISPLMAVKVKGPKGELGMETHRRVTVRMENANLFVDRPDDSNESRAYHGLYYRLLRNILLGVTKGFQKELQIEGVGYRAAAEGKGVTLTLGYSHPIKFAAPPGIQITVPEPTRIVVTGCDKQLVGQVAADLRALRKPEPYKGKGVRYKGEHIRRKVGKTGA